MLWDEDLDPEDANLLWHYTTFDTCPLILISKEIWLSEAQALNDTSELAAVPLALEGAGWVAGSPVRGMSHTQELAMRQHFREEAKRLSLIKHSVYVASFSNSGDLLPQWREYSKRGGAALGFDRDLLSRMAAARDVSLHDVRYAADPLQTVRRAYQGGSYVGTQIRQGKEVDLKPLYREAATIKHNGFRHEQEVRAIYIPDPDGAGTLDIVPHEKWLEGRPVPTNHVALKWYDGHDCALKKICLAPGDVSTDTSRLASDPVLAGVIVRKSTIPVRL